MKFSPTSSHLHPLQVENCDSNSRLVVDEDDTVNSGLKGLTYTAYFYCHNLFIKKVPLVQSVHPFSTEMVYRRQILSNDDPRTERIKTLIIGSGPI